MIYAVTLTVGLISGFMIPIKLEAKGTWILLGLGVLFLAMAYFVGRYYSYSLAAMVDLFTLTGKLDEHGVRRYCAIGYAGVIGGLVVCLRALVGRSGNQD